MQRIWAWPATCAIAALCCLTCALSDLAQACWHERATDLRCFERRQVPIGEISKKHRTGAVFFQRRHRSSVKKADGLPRIATQGIRNQPFVLLTSRS
jgi:hypothetical protein